MRAAFVVLCAVALAGCGAAPAPSAAGPAPSAPAFPAGAAADYQLGGAYPPPPGVAVVARDSTAEPAPGLYNICYVNGFQTQPAERDDWLANRRDLVLFAPDGQPRIDPNWPDELMVDTSTAAERDQLAGIVGAVVDGCARSGFQAVEIDNLDSYTRSGGALTVDDNLAFAKQLAERAHALDMPIGQKNAAELGARGKEQAGFDFAVTEECVRFTECGRYTDVYGQQVLDIEYTDDPGGSPDELCADPARPVSTMIRDRNLVAQGQPEYFYRRC